ncbi:MAG TPA: hypothetical protein PL041_08170 [Melioribacteraceae bacterium]|nr:hypothetical protein [Melioribacteraceae bacterium]
MNKRTVAAIDIGTNSIHMIIVDLFESGKIDIIHRKKEVVRLGNDAFNGEGYLKAETMERALKTLQTFISIAKIFNAIVLTCATSAVREAKNGCEFVNIVKQQLNLEIEIIDGKEEAVLIYKGVTKALNFQEHLTLAFDIGGGSTEFILGNHNELLEDLSSPLGAVRLTKMFFEEGIIKEEGIINCRNHVIKVLKEQVLPKFNGYIIDKYAGTSGTIFSTLQILERKDAGTYLQSLNGGIIKRDKLFKLEELILSKITIEERMNIKGLEQKRADIFPAGIIILSEIFKAFNIKQLYVSTYAMREGMVLRYQQKIQF